MGHCWWPQLLITRWASNDLSPLNSFCVEDSQLAAQLPFPPHHVALPKSIKTKTGKYTVHVEGELMLFKKTIYY